MVPLNILLHLYEYLFLVCDGIDLKAHIWGFIMQLQMFFSPISYLYNLVIYHVCFHDHICMYLS